MLNPPKKSDTKHPENLGCHEEIKPENNSNKEGRRNPAQRLKMSLIKLLLKNNFLT